ncbi:MAG: SDR family NAD(P)-dependent oxidoreductase [Lautropia sp.]|nr:SDR family NAD(P)-dependent oxidoreductase [Lautropia sp.]
MIIGCGDIGQRLVRLLHGHWQVLGLARSAETLARIRQSGAKALASDHAGSPAGTMKRLANWATHIVHAAPPPADGLRDGVPADTLTQTWLTALRRPGAHRRHGRREHAGHRRRHPISVITGLGPTPPARLRRPTNRRRLVYISTTGVYGNRHGAWVTESSRPLAQTDRARRRVDAERLIRQAGRHSPHRLSVLTLRVPGIYAADRLPLQRLKAGVPALLPEDDVITNHIHADDLVRCITSALHRGGSQRVANTVDDSHLRLGEYLDLIADQTGLPRPPRRSRTQLERELGPGRMSFMRESRRITNQRLKHELRVRLRYPTVQDFLRNISVTPSARTGEIRRRSLSTHEETTPPGTNEPVSDDK